VSTAPAAGRQGRGFDPRRLARIVRVTATHLAAHLWMRKPTERRRRIARRFPRLLPRPEASGPERLRMALEEAGGTFIKLGQMLALQPDILSLEYCNALFKLLDRVEPFPYEAVERTFVEELGRPPEEVFDRFERESFAAASIGQVHRATLDGRLLAVKVRRPSVETDFAGDIRLMVWMVKTVRVLRLRRLQWLIEPLSEFIGWTREELDYRNEARYMERLRLNAADNPKERIPAVVGELSGSRILVADFLDGPPVIDYVRSLETGDQLTPRRLAAAGFDADTFARAIIDNFLGDAFRHGLFHADLHPANLLILPGNVVGYVDFGITGVLSVYSRRHLIAMTLAYTRGDLEGMATEFFKVSAMDAGSDPRAFHAGLGRLAETWYEVRGRDRRLRQNFTRVMLDMLRLSRATGIWPERDVIKYIRSAIAIDGLIGRFAPGFDVGAHLQRTCEHYVTGRRLGDAVSGPGLLAASAASSRLAADGPARLQTLLDRVGRGELTVDARIVGPAPAPGEDLAAQLVVLLVFAWLADRAAEGAAFGFNPFTALTVLAVLAFVRLLPALTGSVAGGKEPHHA
jgi:ubiquinone biosynthesis protein